MSNGVNDPHDQLPPIPFPRIMPDGRLSWEHAHRCPTCKSIWPEPGEVESCKESFSALCPACFEHAQADQFDTEDKP